MSTKANAAKAAWKKRLKAAEQGRLLTLQHWIDFLRTGFADMLDLSIDPQGVLRRMRAEADRRRPVAVRADLDLVDHNFVVTIQTGTFTGDAADVTTIIVRPEGDHQVIGAADGPHLAGYQP